MGFGRDCVGICDEGHYADYHWYDPNTYEQLDNNGDVWTPDHAYHKHSCVAVLGRGEDAEAELYEWLKWFSDNGFVIERGDAVPQRGVDPRITMMLGQHRYLRMVRPSA